MDVHRDTRVKHWLTAAGDILKGMAERGEIEREGNELRVYWKSNFCQQTAVNIALV